MAAQNLLIRLAVNGTAQVQGALGNVRSGLTDLNSAVGGVSGALGALGVTLSAGAVLGKLVAVQREFDVLNASLRTMTGSSAAAEREMKWIKVFAKETPFGLKQTTEAFVKMKSLGLDPSREALTSYGNTASAMGKELSQMIEAVADASTGEFERLKEFGIKAKQEGDKVELTFQGVTTSIGNNSAEITGYLEKLGNNEFAGAMALRAGTLDNAISSLGDTWDDLFRTINDQNAGSLIFDSVKLAEGGVVDLITVITALNGTASDNARDNARQTGAMATIQEGLGVVFETVAVLGTNVKYVLVQIGNELGGLAAQAVAVATGQFAQAREIGQLMKADAQAARKEVDATTERILNARKVAALGMPNSYDEPAVVRARAAAADAEVKAKAAALAAEAKAQEKAAKAKADAKAAAAAGAKAASDAAKKAVQEQAEHAKWLQSMEADADAYRQQLFERRMDEHDKLLQAAQVADAAHLAQYATSAASAQQRLQDLQAEAQAMAYAQVNQVSMAVAVEQTTIARLAEKQVSAMGNEAVVLALQKEIEARQQIVGLIASNDAKDASAQAAKAAAEDWQKTADSINQSLTDALMRGFESGKDFGKNLKDTLVNMFKTMVLRPTISAILAPVAGGLSGAANAGGVGGGGGFSGIANLASSAQSMVTLGGQVLSGTMSIANALGTVAANATGTGISGLLATNGAFGTAAGAGGAAGLGASVTAGLAAIGPVGWAAIAVGALGLGGAFSRKLKDSGIEGSFGGERGFEGNSFEFLKGGLFRSNKTNRNPLNEEVRKGLADAFGAMRVQVGTFAAALGLNTAQIAGFTASIKLSTKGLSAEDASKKIQEALGAASDELAQQVLATTEYTRASETASGTLQRLASSLIGVNAVLGTMGLSAYAATLAGADMASQLADRFGGLDALAQASTAYYQTFYMASERAKTSTRLLTERLNVLGIALPESITGFRLLVDGLDLTTQAGRETFAALVQLGPEFAALQTELQQLANETAAKLIAAFTGNGRALPALGDLSGALAAATQQATAFSGPFSTIHRLLGDASSGTLVFGNRLQVATAELSPAQLAVAALQNQVFDLRLAASGTVVDIAGLSAALRNVDTQTFVATVTGVFELIGQRIKSTLAGIADERVSVREAAMRIVGPSAMSAAQIRAQISQNTVALPGQQGIANAQTALANADALARSRSTSNASSQGRLAAALARSQDSEEQLNAARAQLAATSSTIEVYLGRGGAFGTGSKKYRYDPNPAFAAAQTNVGNQAWAASQAAQELALAQTAAALSSQSLSFAQLSQADAAQQAKQAQLDYIKALQTYSVDASRAVTQLGRLREETVKYFESQQQLASLMTGAAGTLRDTVAAFRFEQLDPAAQLASLQERYNVAYSMALSTTGEALAGYGNELNSLINPLLQKAEEAGLSGVAYSSLVSTILARAEATAGRLDAFAPKNYQAESLGLLGQIDSTLMALEQGALTADQLIVKAIDAGKDSTRDGLRAVVAALTGKPVPAFAAGGIHGGGLRLVGEYGPELEATGPSRIYNASDTAAMLRGPAAMRSASADNSELVAEIRAVRAELSALRRETQTLQTQTVVNTGKTARLLDRIADDGMPVRNAADQPLVTEAA